MRIHRNLFYITLALSIISLGLSICWNSIESIKNPFLSNVMLAIFGSSFLVMLSSIVGYFVERRKYSIKYSAFARNFMLQTSYFINFASKNSMNPTEAYREVLYLISIFDSFAFENTADAYYYFLPKGKPRRNMKSLHDSVNDVRLDLLQIKTNALHDINTTILVSQYIPPILFQKVVEIEVKLKKFLSLSTKCKKNHRLPKPINPL